jgi:hypothetical protein
MVFRLLELFGVAMGILFLVFQVILPIVTGDPMFPMLRQKSERKKQAEIDLELNRRLDALEVRLTQQAQVYSRISAIESKLNATQETTEKDSSDDASTNS